MDYDLPDIQPGALDKITNTAVLQHTLANLQNHRNHAILRIDQAIERMNCEIHMDWQRRVIAEGFHKFFLTRWIGYFFYGRAMAHTHADIRAARDYHKRQIEATIRRAHLMQESPAFFEADLGSPQHKRVTGSTDLPNDNLQQ